MNFSKLSHVSGKAAGSIFGRDDECPDADRQRQHSGLKGYELTVEWFLSK